MKSFKHKLRMQFWTHAFCVAAILLSPFNAQAARRNCLLRALSVLEAPLHDSAVELELDTIPQVINMLTTTDGKVGGILKTKEVLPKKFLEWAKKQNLDPATIAELDWDELSLEGKRVLVQSISQNRQQSFFADRRIHGLVVKKELKLTFQKPTSFLGNAYETGEHTIDVSSVLGGKVEYMGPTNVNDFSGVELHFRGNQSAGKMCNDAWTLLDGLNIPRIHQHVHIVAPLPIQILKAEPRLQTALISDFYRRSNLGMEMIGIVNEGDAIAKNVSKGVIYFDSLTQDHLKGVTEYFESVAAGRKLTIRDQFKQAWAGMRGRDAYDQPNLWGLEVRSISQTADPDLYRNLLDALQASMTNQSYGISKEHMQKWLLKNSEKSVPDLMSENWYRSKWQDLVKKQSKQLKREFKDHVEVKMLFHDWSQDVLVYRSPKLAKRIAKAQAEAIKAINKGKSINKSVSNFLIDSGLYQEVLESLGLEVKLR